MPHVFIETLCMRILSAPYCSHSNINSSVLDRSPCDAATPSFCELHFFFYWCQDKNINSLIILSSRGGRSQVWLSFRQQQCLFSICRLGNKYQQTPLYLSIDWMKQSQMDVHTNKFRMVSLPSTGRKRNCRGWCLHLRHTHRLCVSNLFVFFKFFFRRSQVS